MVSERQRARPDQAHLTLEDVADLRDLVEREAAKELSDASDSRVLADLEERPLRLVLGLELGLLRRRAGHHRPELQHSELALPDPDPAIDEEQRPARVDLDRSRDEEPEGQSDDEHEDTHDQIEAALQGPVPARQNRRAQLEERRALPRHVLAALDEELRRVGCKSHLDPLPVRLLDHLEHRALVEVGLGEDHLVGPHLVEDERELGAGAEELETRHGLRRDDADELVGQAAPGSREGAPEAHEAFSRPDEHDTPPDTYGPHELERDRLVCGAQEPDRHRRDQYRRRDEAGGREVVAGPDPECEHDERHDDEARQDPAKSRPQLTLTVETRLGEDQNRDRRGELEPLRRSLSPEQAPEDVPLPGDHLTQDEREVDPQREARDVENDERPNGERAPDDRDDRPAREQIQARGSNITIRGRRLRRRTRHLRRRSDLWARHPMDVRAAPRRPTPRGARPEEALPRARRGR